MLLISVSQNLVDIVDSDIYNNRLYNLKIIGIYLDSWSYWIIKVEKLTRNLLRIYSEFTRNLLGIYSEHFLKYQKSEDSIWIYSPIRLSSDYQTIILV